jgi:hypothetical protein
VSEPRLGHRFPEAHQYRALSGRRLPAFRERVEDTNATHHLTRALD